MEDMEIKFIPFGEERVAPPESFAIKGKAQPDAAPNTMQVIVSDKVKARIDRFLKMTPDTAVKVTCPDGVVVDATFLQWYGNHGLFFISTDCPVHEGVTLAMWILDFPTCIKVVRQ